MSDAVSEEDASRHVRLGGLVRPSFRIVQRGAGCGKTFESLQWLGTEDTYDTFVYVTKQHSAKDVSYNELLDQLKRGVIGGVTLTCDPQKVERGYVAHLERCGVAIRALFLTVDSFMCAMRSLGSVFVHGGDTFTALAGAVADKGANRVNERGGTSVKKQRVRCSSDMLLVLDEAQDLPLDYCNALKRIHEDYGVGVRIIGDKLQSIWNSMNVFTHFLRQGVEEAKKKNLVRRFGAPVLRDLVNAVIDFESHGLPRIELHPDVAGRKGGYRLFDEPPRTELMKSPNVLDEYVETIMRFVRDEGDRPPEHFLFITPCLKNNPLVPRLETELQRYWEGRFGEPAFREALSTDAYWGTHLDACCRYAMVHHSEERGPIDLTASKQAARIQSFHSAKGTGREVVFVLGCTQSALELYSGPVFQDKPNLVFDSLLHVALTRMKERLYVGVAACDLVARRLLDANHHLGGHEVVELTAHSRLAAIQNEFSSDVVTGILLQEFSSEESQLRLAFRFEEVVNDALAVGAGDCETVVDWGHHVMRTAAMHYRALAALPQQVQSQIKQISDKIKLPGGFWFYENVRAYFEHVRRMRQATVSELSGMRWPIMRFKRGRVAERFGDASEVIQSFVERVQGKLKNQAHGLPRLDVLETLIFFHMYAQVERRHIVIISPVELNQLVVAHEMSKNVDGVAVRDPYCRSVDTHHKLVEKVDKCMDKFLTSSPGNEFNVQLKATCRHLKALGEAPSDISISHYFSPIVGYGGDVVQTLMLQPSVSILNIAEMYARAAASAFAAYFMYHEEQAFAKRYRHKPVRASVITLNLDEPVVFEFTPKQISELRPYVRKHLETTFKSKHEIFVTVYQEVYNRNASEMLAKLKTDEFKRFPDYLLRLLKDMSASKKRQEASSKKPIDELMRDMESALGVELDAFWEDEEDDLSEPAAREM